MLIKVLHDVLVIYDTVVEKIEYILFYDFNNPRNFCSFSLYFSCIQNSTLCIVRVYCVYVCNDYSSLNYVLTSEYFCFVFFLKDGAGTCEGDEDACSSVCDSRINSRLKVQVKQVPSTNSLHFYNIEKL